jgi:hypothetical protein
VIASRRFCSCGAPCADRLNCCSRCSSVTVLKSAMRMLSDDIAALDALWHSGLCDDAKLAALRAALPGLLDDLRAIKRMAEGARR